MKDIILAIIEDDKVIRETLARYFEIQEGISFSFAESSVEAFCNRIKTESKKPNVLLLDISLPGITGIQGIPEIKRLIPEISIIMNTIHNDNDKIFSAFKSGADGYVLKNTPLPKLKEGIYDIQTNGAPMSPSIAKKVINHFRASDEKKRNINRVSLTQREKEVIDGLVDGLTYKKLADRLNVSLETIRHHIKNIYSKLNVNSKSQVVAKSLKGEI